MSTHRMNIIRFLDQHKSYIISSDHARFCNYDCFKSTVPSVLNGTEMLSTPSPRDFIPTLSQTIHILYARLNTPLIVRDHDLFCLWHIMDFCSANPLFENTRKYLKCGYVCFFYTALWKYNL